MFFKDKKKRQEIMLGTKGYEEKLHCLFKESNNDPKVFIGAVAEKFAMQEWEHRHQKQFIRDMLDTAEEAERSW